MLSKGLPATVGRYEVVRKIGRGGMGVVFLGRDPRIGRQVAIKLLNTSDEGVAERFLQEARSAGQLKHRNIVTIYDCGEIDDGGELDGLPFIIMEFIDGSTLTDVIREGGPLSMPRKLKLIEDLAAGLDYAHNHGVVHRDVKPANVMIDREGVLKILDFGIARVGESGLTVDGAMLGTPSYMSPEQVAGRPVDRRSDVFAVGLVLYEVLSGRQAFAGTMTRVMHAIASEDPPALGALCPDLDSDLVTIVNRAIEKDEQRRYQTMAALRADLADVRVRLDHRDSNPLDTSLTPAPGRVSAHTPRHITPPEQVARRRSRNIEGHLDRARRAFEAGDFAAAIAAAEDAELLDPRDPRVIDVLTSARDRLDQQQIGTWLAEAEQCIARRDLDGADALVAKALGLDATSSAARHIRSVVGRARREMEHQADAVAAVETARKRFAGGDAAAAISLLDAFSPPHPLVTQARDELASELLRLEQLKRAREEQRRAEALDGALSAAAAHLARHAWDEASMALVDAEAISPHDARLPPLRDALASGREAAWARTKIVTRAVSAAGQLLTAADLDGAERLVGEALAVEPDHRDALALRSRIAERRAAARARDEQDGHPLTSGVRHRAAEEEHAVKTTVRSRHGVRDQREADESAGEAFASDSAGDGASGAFAAPLAAPRRRKAGAAIGVTVAVVVPALLLGLWWRSDSSADRPVRGDIARNEIPTATKPTEVLPPVVPAAGPRPDPATAPAAAPPDSTQPAERTERETPVARTSIESAAENRSAAGAARDSTPPPDPQPRGNPQPQIEMAPALPPPVAAESSAVEARDVAPAVTGASAAPAPVVPTPIPTPPPEVVRPFDPGIAQRILDEYVDVMRRLDFGALQRMYPSAPSQVRLRIEALRKDYSHCDIRFSNVEIAPVTPSTEVTVRASGTESCKPKTRQPSFDRTSRYQFRLVKNADDRWIVGELLSQ